MTCVVGVVGRRGVLLAGDAQASTEYVHRFDRDPKTFQLSETLAVAYCGSGRLGQILAYHLTDSLDEPPLGMDERRWTVRDFIPYLRDVTDQHGHLHTVQATNVEELGESAFLLAVRRRLFAIEADFSVNEHVLPYEALGSGAETAMGSLHASLAGKSTPTPARMEAVARKAIAAAAAFTNYVGGPIATSWTAAYTADEKALARRILAA